MKIERIDVRAAKLTLEQFSDITTYVKHYKSNPELIRASEFKFNADFTTTIQPYCRRFLESRNFDPDYLFKKYKLLSGPVAGRYAYSLIIPYYSYDQPLTFISRHTSKKFYDNCPSEQSIYTTKELLYGHEQCEGTIIVVEGVTDQWRIGDGCVALAGTRFTPRQVEMLADFNRVFILFDPEPEAQKQAEKLQYLLNNHCQEVIVLDLGVDHDPAELSESDVKVLRKQVFSKIF